MYICRPRAAGRRPRARAPGPPPDCGRPPGRFRGQSGGHCPGSGPDLHTAGLPTPGLHTAAAGPWSAYRGGARSAYRRGAPGLHTVAVRPVCIRSRCARLAVPGLPVPAGAAWACGTRGRRNGGGGLDGAAAPGAGPAGAPAPPGGRSRGRRWPAAGPRASAPARQNRRGPAGHRRGGTTGRPARLRLWPAIPLLTAGLTEAAPGLFYEGRPHRSFAHALNEPFSCAARFRRRSRPM